MNDKGLRRLRLFNLLYPYRNITFFIGNHFFMINAIIGIGGYLLDWWPSEGLIGFLIGVGWVADKDGGEMQRSITKIKGEENE